MRLHRRPLFSILALALIAHPACRGGDHANGEVVTELELLNVS